VGALCFAMALNQIRWSLFQVIQRSDERDHNMSPMNGDCNCVNKTNVNPAHRDREKSTIATFTADERLVPASMQNTVQNNKQNEESFAACLLMKDDNHWLIEWLAYHYYVLPLRHLIVVRDPNSATSPSKVLKRWENRINITVWTDQNIIPKWVLRKHNANNTMDAVRLHRYRQQFFYARCLKAFKNDEQRTWVMMTDTDEFIRPNLYHSEANSTKSWSLCQDGSVLKVLQEQINSRSLQDMSWLKPKCLHVPRIQIAAKEHNNESYFSTIVSADSNGSFDNADGGLNASDFLTTRWQCHNGQEIITGHNLDGKNLVNVAWLKASEIPRKAESVHYVIPEYCPATEGGRLHHRDSFLMAYHHPGTFEQFTSREDPRNDIEKRPKRNFKTWKSLGQNPAATIRDATAGDWLPGFINKVGLKRALGLLKGVGVVDEE